MNKLDKIVGINISNKPIHLNHSDLESFSDDSMFKKICPICKEGLLLVKRDLKSFEIVSDDYCILCGQHFIYDDFETIGKI